MHQTVNACFLTCSASDWGGASRVIYTNLMQMDLSRITPVVWLSGDGDVEARLQARGIRCVRRGGLTEPEHKLTYIKAFIKAMRFYRHERIQILHVNHRFWRPAEVLAAWVLRIPVLVHFHVTNDQRGSLMGRCDAALCVSKYVAKHSVDIGLMHEVVYNSVDTQRFCPGEDLRTQWGLNDANTVVSFVGQIRDIKGVQDFIAMAHRIDNPNVRFVIAGECRDPIVYEGSYDLNGLNEMIAGDKRIHYIGYINKVEELYRSSDIIVIPSRWQEPLGLISLEAAACGTSVIASRVGGIPEIIEHNIDGLLFTKGDIEELTQQVTRLIKDPSLRASLAAAAKAKIENTFGHQPVTAFEDVILKYAR